MKNNRKKIVVILVACVLSAVLCFAALAESTLATLFDAAEKLAFDTNNMTLGLEAGFTLDGEFFKGMHASFKQDGENRYISYMLDTPRGDGTMYTGGYTVVGIGDHSWSNDTYWGNFYQEQNCKIHETLMEKDAKMQAALLAVRGILNLVDAATDIPAPAANDQGGSRYELKLDSLPEGVNSMLYYLGMEYLHDNYLFDVWYTGRDYGTSLLYEDREAVVGMYYRLIYGTEMPEWTAENDEEWWGRYTVAYNAVDQLEKEILSQREGGYVYMKADGTCEWFADYSDALRAAGTVTVFYEDYDAAFAAYYEQKTGTPMDKELYTALIYSPNGELGKAFYDLSDEMDEMYRTRAREESPRAIIVRVAGDGSVTYHERAIDPYAPTVTRQLLNSSRSMELKGLNVVIDTDSEGRITMIKGTVGIDVTDTHDKVRTVEAEFTFTASDYGTTKSYEKFDPAEHGLVSADEYYKNMDNGEYEEGDAWEEIVKLVPEKVTFMGVEYDTQMDLYDIDY